MLSVLTPAAHQRLVSLDTIKAELGVTGTEQDAPLLRRINAASRAVAQAWGCTMARQQYVETFAGSDEPEVRLSVSPIEALVAATWLDEALPLASLYDPERGSLWLAAGWTRSSLVTQGLGFSDDPASLDYSATYWAGVLLPEDVTTWEAGATYAAGAWVRPMAPVVLRFQCSAPGAAGGSEPAWPSAVGGTVVDGGVTWTAYGARELPDDLSDACLYEVLEVVRSPIRDRSIRESRTKDNLTAYALHPIVSGGVLGSLRNPDAERILQSYGRRW